MGNVLFYLLISAAEYSYAPVDVIGHLFKAPGFLHLLPLFAAGEGSARGEKPVCAWFTGYQKPACGV